MGDFADVVRRYMSERGLSVRATAKAAGYSDHTLLSKVLNGHKPATPHLARRLDDALGAGGEIKAAVPPQPPAGSAQGRDDASEAQDVMTWLTGTNASDDAIGGLASTAAYLAEAHARMPAAKILPEVLGVHRAVHSFLRSGRQRLSQTRELLRVDSALLAHACLLLGDLGHHEVARAYGSAALLCAQECEADEGLAWTAMAKTARWQERFAEAAGLASRGFGASGQVPVRAELAYREANAMALFGDVPRARAALRRADQAAEGLDDGGTSAWSFSRGRQAIFTLSVCIHTGDPDGALCAAGAADAYWDAGGGKVTATWAQVRAGAAMAYLLKGSLDGAAMELAGVLELPPDQRIRTVTGYLDEVSGMLGARRFADSPLATGLSEQLREFSAVGAATEGES
jgi:hypothetical protein